MTTNDEIGDATIKVSVMLLMIMIMIMIMMVMPEMMLEMLGMAVVTVCYAFNHSLGHTVTRSHGHWVTHSVIRSLTTHSHIPSFMHSVMSTADHQREDSALGKTNFAACSQVTWSMSPVSSAWSTPSVIDPLPPLDVFDAEGSAC